MDQKDDLLERMGWDEEKLKRVQELISQREERRFARTKKLVRILALIALVGAILILIDILSHGKGAPVPVDFMNKRATIAEWVRSGFIKSINDTASTIVIDEATWSKMSEVRKNAIALLFKAYFMEASGNKQFKFTVRGSSSNKLLLSIDNPGVGTKENP